MKKGIRYKIAKAGIQRKLFSRTLHYIFVKVPRKVFDKLNLFTPESKFKYMLPHINYIRRHTPIDNKTIVFVTFRNTYDCNPRAICQEIIDQKLPYRLVQVTRKIPNNLFPTETILVKRDSVEFYEECSRAKIIIDNTINLASMRYKKKKGQILIETWHGAIGMKKFATATNKKWVRKAKKETKLTDYCISNSKFETDLYKSTLWPNAEILEYGHPRNDILFNMTQEKYNTIKKAICKKYEIPVKAKFCLYAPTFRDDKDPSPYNIPYEKLRKALIDRFGGDWVILTRFHQRVKVLFKNIKFPKNVYNVSEFHDIQDIMAVTDCAITDYSSWICEYLVTGRPGFLFATDADKYISYERELVYPLDSTPFPLASTPAALIENIKNFDEEKFAKDQKAFLEKYQCYDDGYASKRTVEKIKELMKKGK